MCGAQLISQASHIEAIFRFGLGNIVAAVAGYATLQIAYFLAAGGDTITVIGSRALSIQVGDDVYIDPQADFRLAAAGKDLVIGQISVRRLEE